MPQVDFTPGLKEMLDTHPEVTLDFDYEHQLVNYLDSNTGEVLLQVPALAWERMESPKVLSS